MEGNYAPVYNMKPEDVERLEVTENHVDVKVMKGVQYSNNVAINVVLKTEPGADKGELELLFVLPEVHSKGIGQAAWKAVEALHPEIRVWETITPYFEKRNIHFYVNRCGFQIVEFWNKHFHGPQIPEDEAGNWEEDDEMFLFRKVVK